MSTHKTLRGTCQCLTVRYRVEDSFAYALYCHCSVCRRSTGAAAKPTAGIPRSKITITAGAESISIVKAEEAQGWHDERCGKCGSLLFALVEATNWAHIAMGMLVDEPSVRIEAHAFVGSKAGWEILPEDGLVRFDGHASEEWLRERKSKSQG